MTSVWIAAVFAGYNAAAFAVAGLDKLFAIRHKRRVPEKTLFALMFTGGAAGVFTAFLLFRHKTQKPLLFRAAAVCAVAETAAIVYILGKAV